MDLIYIKRLYKNKNIRIATVLNFILIITICILVNKYMDKIDANKLYKKYENQLAQVKEIEKIKEAERLAKIPNLTEQGKNNITNIYKGNDKKVFLTFDDGPSKKVTTPILDLLKKENIRATFFVLGSRVELFPEIVKRAYDEGHYIANHGYSHIYSQIYSSPQAVLDEYNKTNNAVKKAIGVPEYNSHLFRYPGGYTGGKYAQIKEAALKLLEENNITHIDWNCLTGDAEKQNATVEELISRLEQTSKDKQRLVILMHDAGNKLSASEALPRIIQLLREKGYEFDNFYSIIK